MPRGKRSQRRRNTDASGAGTSTPYYRGDPHEADTQDEASRRRARPDGRVARRRWRERELALTERGDPAAGRVPALPDPVAFLVLEALVVVLLVVVVATTYARARRAPPELLWGALFCPASTVLPAPAVRNVYLSMSGPVNIAVAALFPP